MLAIEVFARTAFAQSSSDVFVPSDGFVTVRAVAHPSGRPDLLVATGDGGDDVAVVPVQGDGSVVDLGIPGYQVADFDGDGTSEVLSDGFDVDAGVDRSTNAPPTHDGYVGGLTWHGDTRYDFDGDGRNDLMGQSRVALSDGARFVLLDLGWGPGMLFPTGDLDGDGRDDLLRLVYTYPIETWPNGWGDVMEAHYELYLGRDLERGSWPARWSFRPEAHPALPATAVLDSDGDGTRELVVFLEVHEPESVELRVFGGLLDEGGPVLWAVARSAMTDGGFMNAENPALLLPVGDWDGDGDEDVLVHAQSVVGSAALALVDADLDEPLRVVDSFDMWEGENPAFPEPSLDREFVGDFDGDGDLDVAVLHTEGVAFHGVDPTLLEEAVAPVRALGGCRWFGGGGAAAAGFAGLGVLGLRRRRSAG